MQFLGAHTKDSHDCKQVQGLTSALLPIKSSDGEGKGKTNGGGSRLRGGGSERGGGGGGKQSKKMVAEDGAACQEDAWEGSGTRYAQFHGSAQCRHTILGHEPPGGGAGARAGEKESGEDTRVGAGDQGGSRGTGAALSRISMERLEDVRRAIRRGEPFVVTDLSVGTCVHKWTPQYLHAAASAKHLSAGVHVCPFKVAPARGSNVAARYKALAIACRVAPLLS